MDYDEWKAAYRRATMDEGTMRDYIEDLILQRDALNRQVGELEMRIRALEAERNYWQRCAVNNDEEPF